MIVLSNSPAYTHPVDETVVVSITDVVIWHYPQAGYEYRGLIRAYDEVGGLLTEHRDTVRCSSTCTTGPTTPRAGRTPGR